MDQRNRSTEMAAVPHEEIAKMIKKLLDAIGPLPGRISNLLDQHQDRPVSGTEGPQLRSLEFIQAELSGMIASLRHQLLSTELGLDYLDNDVFKKWCRAFCLVAPTMDDYLHRSEQAAHCGCHSQIHRTAAGFFRVAALPLPPSAVKYMEEFLALLTERPFRYMNLLLADDGRPTSTTSGFAQPDTNADAGESGLVGIEDALSNNEIVRRFMDEDMDLKVISIVGPAGVGKTTLAKIIFDKLQDSGYSATAKVEVSQRPDMKELLKNILSQIQLPEIATFGDEQELPMLVHKINRYLQDRRYLIIFDSLWKQSDWDIIKDAFPRNSMRSRVIVTTSLGSVAESCCLTTDYCRYVHKVDPLSEEDSELLFRKTSDSDVSCRNYLEGELLRTCGGIPLFISGLADWLREERMKEEHLKLPTMLKQFERSLSLAYDDLPYWLKVQLLYVGMFPQGYIFGRNSFTERLAAELLADSDNTAEDYFGELIDRNIITQVKNSKHARQVEEDICHWQVNYFMLHFLASKSAENGFLYTSGTLEKSWDKKPRRLSLHEPDPELPGLLAEMNLSYTRSLAISGVVGGIHLDKFMFLGVLDLEGWCCFEEQHWLAICKMFLLRYMSLRKTVVSKLPPKIKDLRKLETLDLSHTQITVLPSEMCLLSELRMLDLRGTPVMRLPEQIQKMQLLRSLLLGGSGTTITKVPEEIRYLHDLHTLVVDLSECSPSLLEALGGLGKLRVLVMNCSFHQSTDRKFQEALCSSTEKWRDLESLTIHCELGCHMEYLSSDLWALSLNLRKFKVTGGKFLNLPKYFHRLDGLAFIEITVYKILEDDLSILGKLGRLESLVLGQQLLPEEAIVIDGESFFCRLQRLSFRCRVPWMTFREGAMPMLTHLELKNMGGSPSSEQCIPSGIINLRSLSEVDLCYSIRYINSPIVKQTVEAVKKEVAMHHKIKLTINGIVQYQQVDVQQEVEPEEQPARRAIESQCEIEIVG